MALYNCYHDTAGTERDEKVLVTVGVVATAEKWIKFEASWGAVLRAYRVSQFHMKDFAHFDNDFAIGWKGDEPKRRAFLADLIRAYKHGINMTFVTAILLDDWHAVDGRYRLTEAFGGPYALAQTGSILRVTGWLSKTRRPSDSFEHFVEYGDIGQPAFVRLAEELKLFKPVVIPKVDQQSGIQRLPFQAADLVAYEHRLALDRYQRGVLKSLRGAFLQVRRMLPLDAKLVAEGGIEDLCVTTRTPKRTA